MICELHINGKPSHGLGLKNEVLFASGRGPCRESLEYYQRLLAGDSGPFYRRAGTVKIVPVEIEISKKHERHPGRDGSYWTKTITVDLPARTATIKETFWDNSTRETSEPTVTTRPATDDEIRQAEDRADCA